MLILSKKKLCFDCPGTGQRASYCRSIKLCLICNSKHHTSICDKKKNILLTADNNACTNTLIVVNIERIKYRALVDTGAGASYVSWTLIIFINQKHQNKTPIRKVFKRTETFASSLMKNLPVYLVELKDIKNEFSFKIETSSKVYTTWVTKPKLPWNIK